MSKFQTNIIRNFPALPGNPDAHHLKFS